MVRIPKKKEIEKCTLQDLDYGKKLKNVENETKTWHDQEAYGEKD